MSRPSPSQLIIIEKFDVLHSSSDTLWIGVRPQRDDPRMRATPNGGRVAELRVRRNEQVLQASLWIPHLRVKFVDHPRPTVDTGNVPLVKALVGIPQFAFRKTSCIAESHLRF